MGADNLISFHKWHKWRIISKKSNILVFDRTNYKSKSLKSVAFRKLRGKGLKFIKYNKYQKLNQSDYVAISDVGAYGASLSSNYNTKPLIAEIIINKSKARVIRKKQDIKSLLNQ